MATNAHIGYIEDGKLHILTCILMATRNTQEEYCMKNIMI